YYEEQKEQAKARSADFIRNRMPKFLSYFERVVERNPAGDGHAVGGHLTYVDLPLFQVVEGLSYAFPEAMKHYAGHYPRLLALRDRVKALPRIAAYLASPRRLTFNENGIFRHYPEHDFAP